MTLLAIASDLDLGTHSLLGGLNVAVMPRKKECNNTLNSAYIKSRAILLETFTLIGTNP